MSNTTKLINEAIKIIKKDNPKEYKKFNHDDWYGELESTIDGIGDEYGLDDEADDYELVLERLVFAGIKKAMKGQRHQCDPYYDDEFQGYDCMSELY